MPIEKLATSIPKTQNMWRETANVTVVKKFHDALERFKSAPVVHAEHAAPFKFKIRKVIVRDYVTQGKALKVFPDPKNPAQLYQVTRSNLKGISKTH